MHELGIVNYVAKAVNHFAASHDVKKVYSVTLEIGEVSGIVPEYLVDCWNYFRRREPLLDEAELRHESLPAVTYCRHCNQEYPTVAHGRSCPYCGSGDTYLLRGSECNIKEIAVL